MKKKISRIMGVVLTAVLMLSLVTLPVAATISQPSVTLGDETISTTSDYTILFQVTDEVPTTGNIVIEFPSETTVPASFLAAEVVVQTTAGFGTPRNANLGLDAAVVDETVTIALTNLGGDIGEFAQVKVKFVGVITNPDDPDDYTLTVKTSEETTAVESAPYTIEAPDVGGLPGIVQVYNPSVIMITQKTGDNAIRDAILAITGDDFIIKIGPGKYSTDVFNTANVGTTFMATGAADATIIALNVIIDTNEITLDGLTFQGEMTVSGDDCTITDCIFEKSADADEDLLVYDTTPITYTCSIENCTFDTTNEDGDEDRAIQVEDPGLSVSACSFIVDEDDEAICVEADDFEASDCEFTGSSGFGIATHGLTTGEATVKDSTFDGLETALILDYEHFDFTGNTITNCTGDAIIVTYTDGSFIIGNTISDNDEDYYGVVVDDNAGETYVIFNNITGNELNIDNNDTVDELDATNNWWGDADGPDSDSISGDVDTTPSLGGPVSAAKGDYGANSLDAKTATGVKISSDATAGTGVFAAASYADNPATATEDPAIGFFDVYISDHGDADTITIRLYGDITADSKVMVWSTLEGAWVEASDQGANTFSGYAWCRVEEEDTVPLIEELGGTAFAVVTAPPPPPSGQLPVELVAPAAGITGVQLSPTFAWSDVGTEFYEFQLSDNPYFADPLVSDSPKLRAPYFDYPADLEYSKTYFWRVRSSISGATSVCVDTECGPWAMGLFTTMDEPVPPPEIIFPEPQPPVIIPPVQEITPTWIYVIIGIGALLVIAVIVLIVTTRRATP